MAFNRQIQLLLLLATLCLSAQSVSARAINITYMNNCQDVSEQGTVYVKDVVYHFSEEDGLCDQAHLTLVITTVDPEPMKMIMTLFKCEEANMQTPCLANPTVHEEMLDCERLKNDDSGPWHMFTAAMDEEYVCGMKDGEIQLNFMRLRLEHLIKYLDVYDATYNTFRLKMYFQSTMTDSLRGCGELDFSLVTV